MTLYISKRIEIPLADTANPCTRGTAYLRSEEKIQIDLFDLLEISSEYFVADLEGFDWDYMSIGDLEYEIDDAKYRVFYWVDHDNNRREIGTIPTTSVAWTSYLLYEAVKRALRNDNA